MKFVLIFGDSAVGKMTVGQELTKITDLRLFHNHMSIEPVIQVFGTYNKQVVKDFRESVFRNFAKSDNYGLIFTCMWAFDCKSDWDAIYAMLDVFKDAEHYFVELVAPQAIRLERNATENRLKHKASKQDIETSNQRLITDDNNHRLESLPGEIPFENYIKIDNSNLPANEVAKIIKDKFGL